MISELIVILLVVAAVSAAAAYVANKRWPQFTIGQLTNRIVTWLVLGTLALMAVGCTMVQQSGCAPDDYVCDGPAMAAAGIMMIGAMIVVAVVLVGASVTYAVLRALRRR